MEKISGFRGPLRFAAVVLASLLIPQMASAVMVTYTTTGVFDTPDGDVSYTGDGTSAISRTYSGTTTNLSFTSAGVSEDLIPGEPVALPLGQFFVSSTSVSFVPMSAEFTLTINQVTPSGNTEFVGTLSGAVRRVNQSQLEIVFDDLFAAAGSDPGVTYTLKNVQGTTFTVSNAGTLEAYVNVVPLPAAAWGGMALFGVLGGVKLRRSRQLA